MSALGCWNKRPCLGLVFIRAVSRTALECSLGRLRSGLSVVLSISAKKKSSLRTGGHGGGGGGGGVTETETKSAKCPRKWSRK